jgi:DNA-binding response OmpR family regulator
MLPESDGFDLCRSIKRHQSLRKIPILILTARTGMEERKKAMESGADGLQTKTIPWSVVKDAVRVLCDA